MCTISTRTNAISTNINNIALIIISVTRELYTAFRISMHAVHEIFLIHIPQNTQSANLEIYMRFHLYQTFYSEVIYSAPSVIIQKRITG